MTTQTVWVASTLGHAARTVWNVIMAAVVWLLARIVCAPLRLVGWRPIARPSLRDEVRVRLSCDRGMAQLGDYLRKHAAFEAHCRQRKHQPRGDRRSPGLS
jgi:hypothetical protein